MIPINSYSVINLVLLLILNTFLCFAQPINLRDTTNQYDYIIITTPEFSSSFTSFITHKSDNRHFKVLVADTTQIYTQFHDSLLNQDKIRDFISYTGKYWKFAHPKYFLLAGNRQSIPNFNYYSYGNPADINTDYGYTQSIYDDDSTNTDFYVGRVPASNKDELNNYLNKIIIYESMETLRSWQNDVLFLAEDNLDFGFIDFAEYDAKLFPSYMHSGLVTNGITNARFGNKDSIIKKLNDGVSSLWMFGMPNDTCFVNNNYLNMADFDQLDNRNKYFLTFAFTQHFAFNSQASIMDKLILSPVGSIGGIARCGQVYYGVLMYSFNLLASNMYLNDTLTLGDYFALYVPAPPNYINMNEKKVESIWGDPSVIIHFDRTTNITENNIPPGIYSLEQNYPNPFNPNTVISYSLPSSSNVKLIVYNTLGQTIKTLESGYKQAGNYSINFNATDLPSGIYFYKLEAGSFSQIKKMILIK